MLRARDYGGFTTARVTATGFTPVDIRIPKDDNNNWISDAGWRASGVLVQDDVQNQWEDVDGPTGQGPPAGGTMGDRLTRWEEYRGFIVRGVHTRTNPQHKDLFVSSDVAGLGLLAEQALEYAVQNLWSRKSVTPNVVIGVRVHRIWGEDNPGMAVEYRIDAGSERVINGRSFNHAATSQQQQPSINTQRAVRIKAGPLPPGQWGDASGQCTGGGTNGGLTPLLTTIVTIAVGNHTGSGASNELKRTIAHEVGHTIHIMHHGPGAQCVDGVSTQGGSVMDSAWADGPAIDHPAANFSPWDVVQIRFWEP